MPVLIGILSSFLSEEKILSGIGWSVFIPVLFFLFIRFPVPKQSLQLPIKQGLKLLTDSILILTGLILFLESGIEGIINNWTTTFLQKANALNNQEALFSLALFVLSLTLTRFILGFLLKRVSSFFILLAGTAVIASGILLLYLTPGYLFSLISLFFLGMGCAAVFPVMLSYVGELFSTISGTAFSIVMVIAMIGNILINYIMGLTAHGFGISHYTTVLFVSLIIMVILLLVAVRRIRQQLTG
jgi:fucose permease